MDSIKERAAKFIEDLREHPVIDIKPEVGLKVYGYYNSHVVGVKRIRLVDDIVFCDTIDGITINMFSKDNDGINLLGDIEDIEDILDSAKDIFKDSEYAEYDIEVKRVFTIKETIRAKCQEDALSQVEEILDKESDQEFVTRAGVTKESKYIVTRKY